VNKPCPNCSTELYPDSPVCDNCGVEIASSGHLLDSLTYWNTRKPAKIRPQLFAVGLVAISGAASALMHTNTIVIVGIAAAVVVYCLTQNK
jgi:uncharacterized OB-fold protein